MVTTVDVQPVPACDGAIIVQILGQLKVSYQAAYFLVLSCSPFDVWRSVSKYIFVVSCKLLKSLITGIRCVSMCIMKA